MTETTLHTATGRDVAELCQVLAAAFQRDPVMSWIMADERFRARRLPDLFEAVLRESHLRHGATEVVRRDGRLVAGAIWDPPGHWNDPPVSGQLGQLRVMSKVFGRRLGSAARGARLINLMERRHPNRPHWYLAQIGSDPEFAGTGLGRLLLDSRLDRCDAEGQPAYLESSAPGNVPLYERFGFRVTEEFNVRGGPAVWAMWREPR
ncbi:GNAT family N-acetyltransferase [Amycolatopsis nigrescens]|uniref:GNAT family N-acetyltransferase n=1 Tax=Amycolatopsis nigrescens TaxID=381445 RepID=UPI000371D5E1|nr:GNAT family N-acetyltransferase [Amycolatopsis nigrescens]